MEAVVGALVLEPVVQVQVRTLRQEIVGSHPRTGAQVAVGYLRVETEPVGEAVGTARPDPAVVLAVTIFRQRVLHEAVYPPGRARVVGDLRDAVGALPLLLREGNDR